ncbi:glycosyltransferase family 4 protein [Dyadobacter crusticola]|uniref:glycosyltransferase family 4 protein n=1 Tax=Dyadobacter crusticola TaxID=292407 RepID=UPI0004E12781|nr:glycosyltransferase [Dyadobacter crusticola]
MKRVLLLSTVHPPTDPRIVYKIAPALAAQYEVICALPQIRQQKAFRTISLPFFKKLSARLLVTYPVLFWKCIRLKPDILHIFVPELIPAAFIFKWLGAKVIYEVQENLDQKFSIKKYNNALIFQLLFAYFDKLARREFFFIFTEKAYLNTYSQLRYPHAVIQNFASIPPSDIYNSIQNSTQASPEFLYVGVISMERCIDVMILAFSKLKNIYPHFKAHFFGALRLDQNALETLPGFDQVRNNLVFYGYTDQQIAFRYASRYVAGIALLKPVADYPDSYTTKLFEYMAFGLPVITSDFPLYRSIVEPSQSGFCISPYDDAALFDKLAFLAENEPKRLEMGNNGKIRVENFYNWKQEIQKLLSFYVDISA